MPTIYDVAERAGVSPSTVSRVFTNARRISEETRARVLAAAQELGYEPSVLGSALTTKKTLMIGLVISDIQNPYAATLARGVQDRLSQEGYVSIICSTDGEPEKEMRMMREILRRGVDGLIITPSQYGFSTEVNDYIRRLLERQTPIVFIGNRLDDPNVDFVTSRAQDGAMQATCYLADLGHRRIAFIGGYYTRGVAVGRWLGYQEAMVARRLPLRPEYMVEAEVSTAGGQEAMTRLLALDEPPTAVLTVNDLMAIGALAACRERGVQVPEDISIIGFDNIPLSALTTPPLTTVEQPAYELGLRAAELVLRRCERPDASPRHILLKSTLVVRGTTASPKY